MIRIQNSGVVAALAVSMILAAAAAQAKMLKFTTEMTGAAEVPPNDSAATGTVEVALDTEAKTVTWVCTHEGLSGDMTAAHFHGPATATEAAGPAIDTTGKTIEGSAAITDEQAAELMAGMYYLNVHTEKLPDGEIRGQLALMQ